SFAPLTVAAWSLAVRANTIRTSSDAHRIGLPKGERVHRCCSPAPAGIAVAIPHHCRFAGYGKLDGSAETRSFVAFSFFHFHVSLPRIRSAIIADPVNTEAKCTLHRRCGRPVPTPSAVAALERARWDAAVRPRA